MSRRLFYSGRRRVFVAEASKIGRTSRAQFADVGDVDVLITEELGDPDVLTELRDAGVKVETVQ